MYELLIFSVCHLCREDQPEAVREDMLAALLNGFASHHAGCLPAWKSLIEELYQRGMYISQTDGEEVTLLESWPMQQLQSLNCL